jgi:hypothetical protein
MRLIDADALIEKAYWHGEHPDVENLYAEGVEAVDVSDIDDAPTIEAEPVRHGRWIKKQEKDTFAGYLYSYECSECGRIEKCREPYCNCGAKMGGGA